MSIQVFGSMATNRVSSAIQIMISTICLMFVMTHLLECGPILVFPVKSCFPSFQTASAPTSHYIIQFPCQPHETVLTGHQKNSRNVITH